MQKPDAQSDEDAGRGHIKQICKPCSFQGRIVSGCKCLLQIAFFRLLSSASQSHNHEILERPTARHMLAWKTLWPIFRRQNSLASDSSQSCIPQQQGALTVADKVRRSYRPTRELS